MVIDQNRCLGCEACTVACRMENHPVAGPWISVQTVGANTKDTPQGHFPDLKMDFVPRICNHCAAPPCEEACPTGVIRRTDDGIVLISRQECNGCGACENACPYGAILTDVTNGIAEKCHFCHHRLAEGLEPFCVICCEGQAMSFGDLDDPESKVSRLIKERGAFVLMPEAGTQPAVFYLPPLARRRLR